MHGLADGPVAFELGECVEADAVSTQSHWYDLLAQTVGHGRCVALRQAFNRCSHPALRSQLRWQTRPKAARGEAAVAPLDSWSTRAGVGSAGPWSYDLRSPFDRLRSTPYSVSQQALDHASTQHTDQWRKPCTLISSANHGCISLSGPPRCLRLIPT